MPLSETAPNAGQCSVMLRRFSGELGAFLWVKILPCFFSPRNYVLTRVDDPVGDCRQKDSGLASEFSTLGSRRAICTES